jgi:hypothetical protein
MRRLFLFLMVLTMLFAVPCGVAMAAGGKFNHSQTTLEWLFDARNDRDGNPNTRVYLVVGGQRYFVMRDTAQFSVVEREQYKDHGVPASAVAACASWWAGSGEELYVTRRGRQLIVYIRYLDEQSQTGRYKRLKVITPRR